MYMYLIADKIIRLASHVESGYASEFSALTAVTYLMVRNFHALILLVL